MKKDQQIDSLIDAQFLRATSIKLPVSPGDPYIVGHFYDDKGNAFFISSYNRISQIARVFFVEGFDIENSPMMSYLQSRQGSSGLVRVPELPSTKFGFEVNAAPCTLSVARLVELNSLQIINGM